MLTDEPFGLLHLDNAKREERWEEFDTTRLLYAADALDRMRSILGDTIMYAPPEIQDNLLRLHKITLEQQEIAEYPDIDEEVFDLAWELESDLYEIQEAAESILKVLNDLTELSPDPDEYDEEEDEEEEY